MEFNIAIHFLVLAIFISLMMRWIIPLIKKGDKMRFEITEDKVKAEIQGSILDSDELDPNDHDDNYML